MTCIMWSTWKIIFILVPLVPFTMFSPIYERYHYQHTIIIDCKCFTSLKLIRLMVKEGAN
jgi:hypothetical protein